MWFRRKVKSGQKIGRKISSPTLNFHVGSFASHYKPGVYTSEVKIEEKIYKGALFFGPKMGGKTNVLEVFIFDFSKTIYNQFVSFKIGKKIRGPIKFNSLDDLKIQIQKDLVIISQG